MDLETPLSPSAANGASPYMEVLIKETVTLHKVLSKYLNGQAVEVNIPRIDVVFVIYSRVLDPFCRRWLCRKCLLRSIMG